MAAREIKRKLTVIFSAPTIGRLKKAGLKYWKSTATALKAIVTIVIALNAGWRLSPSIEAPPKEKLAISLPEKSSANASPSTEVSRKDKAAVETVPKEKTASPLPDKPSIAVLAFANMSDDPKQEYLADGFAEEIINGLSKCPHIIVIARNSNFTYKGKPVKVQQVAEELGMRNVIEGSLRKTGDKVRIIVRLIDALTGAWDATASLSDGGFFQISLT
jgi:TolB-like protein